MARMAETTSVPIVQQGPLPVFFVTGLVAVDAMAEYISLTFCTDQAWGRSTIAEREMAVRLIVPRSDFATMRAQIIAKLDKLMVAAGCH